MQTRTGGARSAPARPRPARPGPARPGPARPGPAGPTRSGPGRSDRLALHPAPLTLGQPAPDAEAFIMLQRVLQALHADLTAPADLLGLPGRAALLREESLRIRLCAERAILPAGFGGVVNADPEPDGRQRDDDICHRAPPTPSMPVPSPPGHGNYTDEITPACLALSQAGYVVKAVFLTLMTGKSTQNPGAPASPRGRRTPGNGLPGGLTGPA